MSDPAAGRHILSRRRRARADGGSSSSSSSWLDDAMPACVSEPKGAVAYAVCMAESSATTDHWYVRMHSWAAVLELVSSFLGLFLPPSCAPPGVGAAVSLCSRSVAAIKSLLQLLQLHHAVRELVGVPAHHHRVGPGRGIIAEPGVDRCRRLQRRLVRPGRARRGELVGEKNCTFGS
jgi:hypothetical protein